MELKVSESKEIVVIPSLFKDEDKPMKFVFRVPTAAETLDYSIYNNVNELTVNCFVRFENKAVVKNADKELVYNDYREFINLGASKEIDLIHAECALKLVGETQSIKDKADKTEKK